ncbi:MAG: hypothetical protein PWR03_2123 [Tenuifilum sp.]|jgi:hypothetical protein|uniref:hypothetical protein n=1 Tax=Tenuifilum sp. TaxID=2760880 RepID=UPI0024AA4571|nr:hypothetical protein [Tenuifilum sp.]MDI3527939.1 hypothetical protein [Tenuifilum sp.]
MEFYPIPQPDEVSDIEKDDAMGAYFMMFATTGLGLPLPILENFEIICSHPNVSKRIKNILEFKENGK